VIELASTTPSAANIAAYADIVREKSILRQLIDVGTEHRQRRFQPGRAAPAANCWKRPSRSVFRIAEAGIPRTPGLRRDARCAVKEAFRILQERYENQGRRHRLAHRLHRLRRE
jgi:replicative DNA helicase